MKSIEKFSLISYSKFNQKYLKHDWRNYYRFENKFQFHAHNKVHLTTLKLPIKSHHVRTISGNKMSQQRFNNKLMLRSLCNICEPIMSKSAGNSA